MDMGECRCIGRDSMPTREIHYMLRIVKSLSAVFVALSLLIALSPTAWAHDPIFLSDDQTTPDTGPYMPDGTISWALYGSVLEAGDTRGFEFDLREGDELFVSLLIPNLSPEVDLSDDELPIINLVSPDGSQVTIAPEIRDVFDEPFSNTSYVTLSELRVPGQAGRYRGTVIGAAPSRFSVAIGETEIFFTETERSGDRPSNFLEITAPLTAWYTTPPGGEQDTSALAEGEAEIDLEMIEEAMESGVAQAPEESIASSEGVEAGPVTEEAEPTPEPEPTDEPEPDATEESAAAASSLVAEDDAAAATWVAPVAIGAVAVVGAGTFFVRRGRKDRHEPATIDA